MKASPLLNRRSVQDLPIDQVYVIYGAPGSGKTSLAASFPKSEDAPLLIIDILEGGTASIATKNLKNVEVIQIQAFEELDQVLTDLMNGYTIDPTTGQQVPLKFSTIVLDTVTQMEWLSKEYLKATNNKSSMNINLWGQNRDNHENIYNTLKALHQATGAIIVAIAHENEIKDENNPDFAKLIPSIQRTASFSLCAKASYVWYTKVENETTIQPDGTVVQYPAFYTYIDSMPYLLTKCRKPTDFKIVSKVKDLTYATFKANVIDKMRK